MKPVLLLFLFVLIACGGGEADAPAGTATSSTPAASTAGLPVDHVEVGAIDAALAARGQGWVQRTLPRLVARHPGRRWSPARA